MKCDEVCQLMPDLAAGLDTATAEVKEHLRSCAACAGKLEEFRQTMLLLDEWQAPEPSPYFDTRLMARVREEKAKPTSWLYWLRKPALAVSLAVLMVMSVTLFRTDAGFPNHDDRGSMAGVAEPGTAVGDLQVQQDVSANP